jgi:hypothetical protein
MFVRRGAGIFPTTVLEEIEIDICAQFTLSVSVTVFELAKQNSYATRTFPASDVAFPQR